MNTRTVAAVRARTLPRGEAWPAALAMAAALAAGAWELRAVEPEAVERRVAEGAALLASLPRAAYTVQLLLACEGANAIDALDARDSEAPLFLVPTAHKGKTCYRVLSGVFRSRQEALAAAGRAPGRFDRPVPVRIGSLPHRNRPPLPEAGPLPEERPAVALEPEAPPRPEPVHLIPRTSPTGTHPPSTPPPS